MRPVVITGATGTLGRAFEKLCAERHLACHVTSRAELDITSSDSVAHALDRREPWLVINTAGYVRVDEAEGDHERCHRENALGPQTLAAACATRNVSLVTFSSDLVFDGEKREPYHEEDAPAPLGVYGKTKHEAEQRVLDQHPDALVVRTSAFFGPWDEYNFVTRSLRALAEGKEVRVPAGMVVSPTYVPDLVHATLDLAIDGEAGLWHLANVGKTTWAELARTAARIAGHTPDRVTEVPAETLGWSARRPRFSALGSVRGHLLPTLGDALHRYHHVRKQEGR